MESPINLFIIKGLSYHRLFSGNPNRGIEQTLFYLPLTAIV